MKIKLILLPLLLMASLQVHATGDEKENGGDILVCGPRRAKTYEVLDLYEAKSLYHFTIAPVVGKDLAAIFDERVRGLDGLNPSRSHLYREYFKTFQGEARFVPDSEFTDVPDEGFKAIPKGCKLRQAIVQYDGPTPQGIRYVINEDLWKKLSLENQVALLLHEFIYREGRKPANDFRTSSGVRYFNGIIHSSDLQSITLEEYFKRLRRVGFQEVEAQGEPVVLFTWNAARTEKTPKEIQFHENGAVAQATLADHFVVPGLEDNNAEVKCESKITSDHQVLFFTSGHIAQVEAGCELRGYRFHSQSGRGSISGSIFQYQADGTLVSVSTKSNHQRVIEYDTDDISIWGAFYTSDEDQVVLVFYEDGTPKEIWSTNFKDWRLFRQGLEDKDFFHRVKGKLTFDKSGRLQEPE